MSDTRDWVVILDQGYYGNPVEDTQVIGPMTEKEAHAQMEKLIEYHEKRAIIFSCFSVRMSEPTTEEEFASFYDEEESV